MRLEVHDDAHDTRTRLLAGLMNAQKFEVASVKPCVPGDSGGGRGGGQEPSPDRLTVNCQSVESMIRMAYITFANSQPTSPRPPIDGGPGWIRSERYRITAKAEGTPGQSVMRGPMMKALLEDRFKVKVHWETREVPVYLLTVAKGGPKLQPFQEGSCVIFDPEHEPPMPGPGTKFPTICAGRELHRGTPVLKWEVHGGTIDDLCKALGSDLDRIVINKTGIAGKFDFYLEFAPDETTAGLNALRVGGEQGPPQPLDPSGGPSIFTAIQAQLGLKLEAGKGPREFLVIDRAERPSEN